MEERVKDKTEMKSDKVKKVINLIFTYAMYVFLIVYCISLIIPLIWMVFTACKSFYEFYDNMFLWPEKWVFTNFKTALEKINSMTTIVSGKRIHYNVGSMAMVSIIYSTISPLPSLFFSTAMAYVMSKYQFKGNAFIYGLGLFVMITPLYGSSVSNMVLKRQWGIYDNMLAQILISPYIPFCGLNFMILYAAFKGLSWSYAEAAFIDGAGHWSVFLRIMLPMMLPTCAVLYVLSFLSHWNNYSTFLVWLPSYPNLAYGMYKFQNDFLLYGGTINEIMAGLALIMIPSATLFLSSQKLITSKFTVGGLKG